ncbi:MAG TPA: sugar phosphate isomerase/epimerase family protein [Lacipirellulaceae bacterium]|nr:sugar phosphate isomerase/epimerase family protein [Lacipirellulaceae bacterium]
MTLLSMNEITTFRWSLEEDVENYQQAGYRAIGVWRQKLSDGDEDRAIDLVAESGLVVSNLMWAGGFTGSDGRTLAESIDDAAEAIRLAAALQAGCLVIYPGGRNNHTYRHAGRVLRSALDQLLPLAEAADVPLAIEPMHAACAAEWTFLTDVKSVVTFVEEYRSPCLKIAYDTYHFPFGARHRHVLERLVPHIAIVHLADRRLPPSIDQLRCPLGHGRLPLTEIVATLQESGYAGAFDVKLIGPDIEINNYWTVLEQSQVAFAELAQSPARSSLA